MITLEQIKANESLASITDEQANCILSLANNAIQEATDKRTAELYSSIDKELATFNQVAREPNERTVNYIKRSMEACTDAVKAANAAKKAAEDTLKANGSEELKKALAERDEAITKSKKENADLLKSVSEMQAKYTADIFNLRTETEYKAALGSLKLKKDLPQSVVEVLQRQAIDKVKAMSPEFVEVDGKQVLVFKNEDGSIRRNQSNGLNPYTAEELIRAELEAMQVLEAKHTQTGIETKPQQQQPIKTEDGAIVVSANTQREAMQMIEQEMRRQGIQPFMAKYSEVLTASLKASNVNKLPK